MEVVGDRKGDREGGTRKELLLKGVRGQQGERAGAVGGNLGCCQGTVVLTGSAAGIETSMALPGSTDVKNSLGNHFSFLPALNPNFPTAVAEGWISIALEGPVSYSNGHSANCAAHKSIRSWKCRWSIIVHHPK